MNSLSQAHPERLHALDQQLAEVRAFLTEKAYAKAEMYCRTLLMEFPGHPAVLYHLGMSLFDGGNHQEGVQTLQQALNAQPHRPEWWLHTGQRLQNIAAYPAARQCYDRLLALQPDNLGATFDRHYRNALEKTNGAPFPLARRQRFAVLAEALQSTLMLEGAFAECGCFRGLSTNMLCAYIRDHDPGFSGKNFYAFDSFEGLSEPQAEDAIPDDLPGAGNLRRMTQAGFFASDLETIRQNTADFPDITFTKGWLPASLKGQPERQYAFVNLDVDLYEPTKGVLEYFYPRLVPGGLIISDDYNWPGAKKAIDDFCAAEGLTPECTPFNQAIVRRPLCSD